MARINEREAILNIQRYLRQLSFVSNKIPTPPLDGIYGTHTKEAVKAFQESVELPPSGVVDLVTWERLFAEYEKSLVRESAPLPLAQFPRISEGYALRAGDESFLVRLIQYALSELESIYPDLGEVQETGVYDEATVRGVKNLQRRVGLRATGEVDRATWDALATVYNREFGGYRAE